MIEAISLQKRYGEHRALEDVSFQVKKGQIVGFLGANGAGKTTTMDILCGCLGATRGTAKIAGFDIAENPIEAKRRIGYLPDEPPLHNDMKVEDYIRYAGNLRQLKGESLRQRVEIILDQLNLGDMRSRLIGNLSKGYRQRVGLAQALIHDPEVLILDEPTEGLDPIQIIQIRELIRSLKGSHTILFSSHILSEVSSICDELIIIHQGRVVETGSYEKILQQSSTHKQYELEVQHDLEGLAARLEQLQGVDQVIRSEEGGRKINFTLHTENTSLDDVLASVVQGKHGIQSLASKSKTLEDVFFQLTK